MTTPCADPSTELPPPPAAAPDGVRNGATIPNGGGGGRGGGEGVVVDVDVAPRPKKRKKLLSSRSKALLAILSLLVVSSLLFVARSTTTTRDFFGGDIVAKKRGERKSPPRFFFGIKAGAHEAHRRAAWRNSSCASYYASQTDVAWSFVVGRPYEPGHDLTKHYQGAIDTASERSTAETLLRESERHGDVVALPMRDQYGSLPDKTVGSLNYALWHYPHTPYLGAHDVEFCVNVTVAAMIADEFESSHKCNSSLPASMPTMTEDDAAGEECPPDKYHDLYAGHLLWKGTEYKIMLAADKRPKPFLSGWAYFLSRHLVHVVTEVDRTRSVFNGLYGSVSEDLDLGRMVAYANETHGVRTYYRAVRKLVMTAEKVRWDNETGRYVGALK